MPVHAGNDYVTVEVHPYSAYLCKPVCKNKIFFFSLLLDINECTTNVHNCDPNAFCNNTDESYTCTCAPGYTEMEQHAPPVYHYD